MIEINIVNHRYENVGKLNCAADLGSESINVPVVHSVVKALLANRRQGNACTKTKGFISGGGKKPFKQKGTGRARQGSNRSPLHVGGGTVFGPQPRDYSQKINKKVMLQAIKSVIADKLNAGKLVIVDTFQSNGKTSEAYKELSSKSLLPALIVVADKESLMLRATKNLQKGRGLHVDGFSVYEALKYENLIIEKSAFESLMERVG